MIFMNITVYTLLIWATAIIIVSLDLVIFIGSRNLSSKIFVFLTFVTAIWVASQGFLVSTFSDQFADWSIRFQYVLGLIISSGFFHFSVIYPHDKRVRPSTSIAAVFLIIVSCFLYFYTDKMIAGVSLIGGPGRWAWHMGSLNFLYSITFCGLWTVSLKNLFNSYKAATGELRLNLRNMFIAIFIGIIPPTLANIILPSLGIFYLNWLGPISSAVWVFIIAYSIIRYRQMNVHSVITEVLAIGMTVIFFINIFIDIPFGIWGRVATFIIFLVLAYYLIRSALRESHQKERLANLNLDLSEKVAEQTLEIRKSYDLEKKARRELEKLNETKDQFIMITQHHLRTPVTSIRWGLEEALKGTYGTLKPQLEKALLDTQTAANRLQRIVDDFLSITALKVGSQILNIAPTSMLPLVEDVLAELHYDIEQKHVEVSFPTGAQSWPQLPMDAPKIREVILIVIENALRYNIEHGSIKIYTTTDNGSFLMTVENTGIGLTSEEKERLFTSLFYRGDAARSAHPIGMGVGLSVSRAIVRAHHGELSISSEGKGRGAKAVISIPISRVRADLSL